MKKIKIPKKQDFFIKHAFVLRANVRDEKEGKGESGGIERWEGTA